MKLFTIFLTIGIILLWAGTVKLYWKSYADMLVEEEDFKMDQYDWIMAVLMHIPLLGSIFVIWTIGSDTDIFDDPDQHFFI